MINQILTTEFSSCLSTEHDKILLDLVLTQYYANTQNKHSFYLNKGTRKTNVTQATEMGIKLVQGVIALIGMESVSLRGLFHKGMLQTDTKGFDTVYTFMVHGDYCLEKSV